MRFKWTGKRFEWFKSTLDMWGTIAPPDSDRFAQPADVYLDLGAPGRCIRNIYVENLLDCTGTAFNLSGVSSAGATSFSGLIDTSGVYTSGQLTRWDGNFWQPYNETGGGSVSLSGLVDVQLTPWISGNLLGWNGSQYVPTTNASVALSNVSGHFESQFSATDSIQFTHSLGTHPQVTVLDSIFCEQDVQVCHDNANQTTISFNGTISGWFQADIGLAGLAGADGDDGATGVDGTDGADGTDGSLALSGLTDDTTIDVPQLVSGHLLSYDGTVWRSASRFFQPSGFQVPSGDYATVSQGHILWMTSGIFEASGISTIVLANHLADVGDPHTQYLTEAAAATTYRISGANLEANDDVARVSPLVSGHTLGWNGTNWVNTTPGGGGDASALPDLSDVNLGTLVSGHHLSYNGTEWINADEAGGDGNDILTVNSRTDVEVAITIFTSGFTADATSFAIPSLPAQGIHRYTLEVWTRSARSADQETLLFSFNGDTTAGNYPRSEINVSNGTEGANEVDSRDMGVIVAANGPANHWSFTSMEIREPESDKAYKNYLTRWNAMATTTRNAAFSNGMWQNTAPITSIDISTLNSTNMLSGTVIRLTGYKTVSAVNGTLGDAVITAGLITG